MTLRDVLTQAAFWHDRICLECGARAEEEDSECPECGGEALVDAPSLLALIERVEEEGD